MLTHSEHGVLAYQPPVTFIRSINFSTGVLGLRVRIKSPKTESPRSKIDSYEVSEISHEHLMNIEPTLLGPSFSQFFDAKVRRQGRAQAHRYDQTWVGYGQCEEALKFIRSRRGRVRSSVLVADPYFGALQISQFLLAVLRIDAEARKERRAEFKKNP